MRCEELEDTLASIREDIVEALNAWVVRTHSPTLSSEYGLNTKVSQSTVTIIKTYMKWKELKCLPVWTLFSSSYIVCLSFRIFLHSLATARVTETSLQFEGFSLSPSLTVGTILLYSSFLLFLSLLGVLLFCFSLSYRI